MFVRLLFFIGDALGIGELLASELKVVAGLLCAVVFPYKKPVILDNVNPRILRHSALGRNKIVQTFPRPLFC